MNSARGDGSDGLYTLSLTDIQLAKTKTSRFLFDTSSPMSCKGCWEMT